MKNPDRIDFLTLKNKTIVNKLEKHNGRDIVVSNVVKTDFDLDAALDWCRANGYTVRTWDGGARAFKGSPWVIRTRRQIQKTWQNFYGEGKVNMDFAYDG